MCGAACAGRKVFCSDLHRVQAWRLARLVVADCCVECSLPMEQPARGRKRIRCGSEQCEQNRRHRRYARELEELGKRMAEVCERTGWDATGFVMDKPADRAQYTTVPTEGCDVDPLAFADGWDAEGFVAEFGRSGDEVGCTYEGVGSTLGAGCG